VPANIQAWMPFNHSKGWSSSLGSLVAANEIETLNCIWSARVSFSRLLQLLSQDPHPGKTGVGTRAYACAGSISVLYLSSKRLRRAGEPTSCDAGLRRGDARQGAKALREMFKLRLRRLGLRLRGGHAFGLLLLFCELVGLA